MEYDLVIRGGRVVDGSGFPSYLADIGVKDGKIVEVGRISAVASAARAIDASGLVVSPGFIDHHTHLDAQILWDPYGTCEPENGITSIVMGNCGLTLAPLKDGDEDAIVKSFVRVEAIPRHALEKGIRWRWHSFGEYLDALEGNIGVNVGCLVGHIAVRQHVMGEDSVAREATPEEIGRMRALVRAGMEAGALGFSTNRNNRHNREDGKPVGSRLANDQELLSLCGVLGDLNAGVIETIFGGHRPEHFGLYEEITRETQRPVIWQTVQHRWAEPNLWREQLDSVEPIFRKGYQAYGLTHVVPLARRFTMKNSQLFDEFPKWKPVMFLPLEPRKQALADAETRRVLKKDLAENHAANFHRRWDIVRVDKVVKPENQKYVGKTVEEVAAMRQQEPLDALLDLSLEEDLETTFWNSNTGGDPVAMAEILNSPYVLAGTSDAGAHVQFGADFGYGTTLLGLWVRERGAMSLEKAVNKLTFEVASVYGISDRGLLRSGYAADIAIFDPETIRAREPEWAEDYPGATRRLIQRSEGMHTVIVNGKAIYQDRKLTGDLPGQVLRGAAHHLPNV
jgi:N-acyl-D-amino-acid deacylase